MQKSGKMSEGGVSLRQKNRKIALSLKKKMSIIAVFFSLDIFRDARDMMKKVGVTCENRP